MKTSENIRSVTLAALLALSLSAGCAATTAQVSADEVRSAATSAVHALELAQDNPELVEAGAAALRSLVEKVAPEDASTVGLALGHINAGGVSDALTVARFVAAKLAR